MAPLAHAGEVPSAVVTLEAISSRPGDQVAAALPLRFVLLESGQVFVGGTSELLAGQLGKDEATGLERRVNDVRKLPGLGSTVTFGPGPGFRLVLGKSKPLDILVQGDPAAAPASLGSAIPPFVPGHRRVMPSVFARDSSSAAAGPGPCP
jgi:hypothetical protein